MLMVLLMKHGYVLGDPAMEDALIEMATTHRFAGSDGISERILKEGTILSFRHLLESHDVGTPIDRFGEVCVHELVKAHLKQQGMSMPEGARMDAVCSRSPAPPFRAPCPSVPEAVINSGDKEDRLFHALWTTAANLDDVTPAADLLPGEAVGVSVDAGYLGIEK
jgi:IS5 family transposase